MSLKTDLTARVRALEQHRAKVLQRHTTELAGIDRQLEGAAALLAEWDTLTIDEALAAVEAAGFRVQVE